MAALRLFRLGSLAAAWREALSLPAMDLLGTTALLSAQASAGSFRSHYTT